MVSIIYLKARFQTAGRRNNALAQITNWIAANVVPDDLVVPAQAAAYDGAYKGWPNALTAELRFKTAAPRDDLWVTLDTFLSTAGNAPQESLGEKWDQALDAPNPDADTTRYNYVTAHWPLA